MYKRLYGLLVSLLAFTSYASAQPADFVGIIPLITGILGIEGNFTVVLGFLATFGFINFAVYIVFKVLFKSASEKTDLVSERTFFGGRDGRNLVAVLSVLFTVSGVFGLGGAGVINSFQGVIILALAMGLLAFLAVVVLGGGGAALGSIPFAGGAGARAAGKGLKEGGKQIGADTAASKAQEGANAAFSRVGGLLDSATDRISSGEENAGAGNYEDAERAFEDAIEALERIESSTAEGIQDLQEEITGDGGAVQRLDGAIEDEREEEGQVADLGQRIKRIYLFLKYMQDEDGYNVFDSSGDNLTFTGEFERNIVDKFYDGDIDTVFITGRTGVDDNLYTDHSGTYGVPEIGDDINHINQDLNMIQGKFEDEEGKVVRAFKELQDAAVKGAKTRIILKRIYELLDELEEDSEEMEAIEQKRNFKNLYQATEEDEEEEKEMEQKLEDLKQMKEDLEEEVEAAWNRMEEFLSYDEEEIRDLREELKYEEELGELVERYGDAAANSDYDRIEGDMEQIRDDLFDIDRKMQEVISEMGGEEEKIAGGLRSMVSNLRNSGDGGFDGNLAEEMEEWLGSSSVTS
jgi:hypothetical protein